MEFNYILSAVIMKGGHSLPLKLHIEDCISLLLILLGQTMVTRLLNGAKSPILNAKIIK